MYGNPISDSTRFFGGNREVEQVVGRLVTMSSSPARLRATVASGMREPDAVVFVRAHRDSDPAVL
jgi:hypothetical protein